MKSIMEEASSIFKAIEKAWLRAEKPQSFSIKVLEEAEKNFFGMTTKSAKIALLFEEPIVATHKPRQQAPAQQQQPQAPRRQPQAAPVQNRESHRENRQPQQPRQQQNRQQHERPVREQEPRESVRSVNKQAPQQAAPKPQADEQPAAIWTPAMTASAHHWISNIIQSMGKDTQFTHEVKNNQLVFEFNKGLVENGRDRMLFSSLAHLLMQSIRHEFKNQTRGLKVILKLQN